MGITTEQYAKIIRFLDAEMEPAEMDDFEKELDSNPEMRNQLNFEQSLRDSFALRSISNLSSASTSLQSSGNMDIPSKIIGIRRWIAIGAAVITAFVLFSIFWQKLKNTSNLAHVKDVDTTQKTTITPEAIVSATVKDSVEVADLALLFKQYFKKETLPEHYPLYLAEALTDYESGKYSTLQKLNLKDLPQTRSTGETDSKENILLLGHYYKGLAFLQINNTEEAASNLEWILKNQPGKTLKAEAQWYLALTYLKENNKQKTVELCNSIIKDKENRLLVKNAAEILNALGK